MSARILPFVRPLPQVAADVAQLPSAHLPGVDAGLSKNPGAVGGDHTSPLRDLTETPGPPASMRRMLYLNCLSCGTDWVAPGLGNCAHCGSDQVLAAAERSCLLPRA